MSLIAKLIYGSHLFGTSDEHSDLDYQGIYLASKEDIILNEVTREVIFKDEVHKIEEKYYSLQYFIDLACQGQTVALDLLHAPSSMTLVTTPIWEEIKSLKNKFFSKNIHSFLHYAKSQAIKYSLKGDRLRDLEKVIALFAKQESLQTRLKDVWHDLPRTENCYEAEKNEQNIKQYFFCGKIFLETQKIGYVLPVLKNLFHSYGERARQAEENVGLDWKAISHAVRVLMEVKELLTEQTITFPLKQSKLVSNIKQGKENYVQVVSPLLDSLTSEIDSLLQQSTLPEYVDIDFWDEWLVRTIEREVFTRKKDD
jgi:predicted nucleotidyltransferase